MLITDAWVRAVFAPVRTNNQLLIYNTDLTKVKVPVVGSQ